MSLHRLPLASLGLAGLLWLSGSEPVPAQAPVPETIDHAACCPGHCGHAWCACLHRRAPWDMQTYGRRAAGTFFDTLNTQSMNGRALELTVWNHYFEPQSATLLPSGVAYLNRLARRQPPQVDFLVLLETTRDVEYTPDQVEGYAQRCDQLDANRAAAVREYVTKVLRRPNPQVLIHNPAPVGMAADEATSAYTKMIIDAQGVLSREMIQGAETPGWTYRSLVK